MSLASDERSGADRRVARIGVIGPGIVGMPMAALLARAAARGVLPSRPEVVVVQRASPTSGWKVDAINAGQSPIGGVEPELDAAVAEAVAAGTLRATHDYGALAEADIVLVCTQTDKDGLAPDYGPLSGAMDDLAGALRKRPAGNVPVVVFESTLAPSSMQTVVREAFARHGLHEGRDVLLGNSPNRVMPGRLVERVATSDKLVAGLDPATPPAIAQVYGAVVTRGSLHQTNSLTAEVVKTLENAYRDVRIAFSAEVARYCDARDIDFHEVRRQVNDRLGQTDDASANPTAVPTGGLLVPMVGVGGHCLPKDGILLCWRRLEEDVVAGSGLFLTARHINDESPGEALRLAEREWGESLSGHRVALLGAAYRFDSEDTRNSPSLVLARQLLEHGCPVVVHDPYVRPGDQNLVRLRLDPYFTNDVEDAVRDAEIVFLCTGHQVYADEWQGILRAAPRGVRVFDGCNLLARGAVAPPARYAGIGRGTGVPDGGLVDSVMRAFRALERGVANELFELVEFLNARYADSAFNRIDFHEVQRLAATCTTGCAIVDPGPVGGANRYDAFASRLVAQASSRERVTASSAIGR